MSIKLDFKVLALIAVGALLVVAIAIIFHGCGPRPASAREREILDSIQVVQNTRDSIHARSMDSAVAIEQQAQKNVLEYSARAIAAEAKLNQLKGASVVLKSNYQKLIDSNSTKEQVIVACNEMMDANQRTFIQYDSVNALNKKIINEQSHQIIVLHKQVTIQSDRAAGFKSDFMKVKTDVVAPLETKLAYANKQWAQNRFWKKTGWGVAAAALIYGTIQTFKK